MKLSIKLKALQGDRVLVMNPRKKYETWEYGKVTLIEIKVSASKKLYAIYRVVLERESIRQSYRSKMRGIVLYVGEDKIERL